MPLTFFLTNKYGQWIAILVTVGIGIVTFFYFHDKNIRDEAAAQFNASQQALILKSQNDLIQKTETLIKVQNEIRQKLQANTDDLKAKIDRFSFDNDHSNLSGKNDEVSPFLRDSIERLRQSR